jgi:DNA polymerase III sliding clamp (beta) subunit (PCNA family)
MNIRLSKRSLVENLLVPASKLSDNVSLDFASDTSCLKTLVTSSDNSTILLASIPCELKDPFKCIIPDSKTFLRLFAGIDQENITLDIDSNVVKYSSSGLSFKYHLLDDSYINNKKAISEEKLDQLTFDTTFVLSKAKLSDILKFNSIIPDAEKLYFSTDNFNNVVAKIGDDQKCNTNEINIEVSEAFEGEAIIESIPLNIQNILLLSFNSDSISVSVNHKLKIFKFETPLTKYIISGLVK